MREFGLKAAVAVNRFPTDPDEELDAVRKLALDYGAHAAELNEAFERGGEGAASLAEAIVDAAEQPNDFDFLYPEDASIAEKIEASASACTGPTASLPPGRAGQAAHVHGAGLRHAAGLHGEDAPLARTIRRS